VQDFSAINGKKFKIDSRRLCFSLQWLHDAHPPDFHLTLVRNPRPCCDFVATLLFGELVRHDPQYAEHCAPQRLSRK
jgi:hypothetical protein